jgi:hypothetical protein
MAAVSLATMLLITRIINYLNPDSQEQNNPELGQSHLRSSTTELSSTSMWESFFSAELSSSITPLTLSNWQSKPAAGVLSRRLALVDVWEFGMLSS